MTTGSDVYSYGVLIWSLYTGQQPYVCAAGRLVPNRQFPHFLNTSHPQYMTLARRCLQADPHDRPTFADISSCLHDLFGQLDTPSSSGSVGEGQGRGEITSQRRQGEVMSLRGSRSKLGSSLQVHLETLRAAGVVTPVLTVWSARGHALSTRPLDDCVECPRACPAYTTL